MHLQECVSAMHKCMQGGVSREAVFGEAAACYERLWIERA